MDVDDSPPPRGFGEQGNIANFELGNRETKT